MSATLTPPAAAPPTPDPPGPDGPGRSIASIPRWAWALGVVVLWVGIWALTKGTDTLALAGQRSRHNVYMSIPLVMAMSNQHATMFDGRDLYAVPILILVGFLAAHLLFLKSAKVQIG